MAPAHRNIGDAGHMKMPEEPGSDPRTIALARSRLYQFFAVALSYPDARFAALWQREGYGEALQNLACLLAQPHRRGRSLVKALEATFKALAAIHTDDLQRAYRHIFGHTMAVECAAYETLYSSGDVFQQVQALADIAGWYRAFGLVVSPAAKERVDHISVELEFMYVLGYKEAYAVGRGAADKAQLCAEAQAKFLQEHLGRWGPRFARSLRRTAEDRFYRTLAQGLRAFLALEIARFGLRPLALSQIPPGLMPPRTEPDCGACPLLTGEGQAWAEESR